MKPNASVSVCASALSMVPAARPPAAAPASRHGDPGGHPGPPGEVDDRDHPASLEVELPAPLTRGLDDEVAQEPGGRSNDSEYRASSRSSPAWSGYGRASNRPPAAEPRNPTPGGCR